MMRPFRLSNFRRKANLEVGKASIHSGKGCRHQAQPTEPYSTEPGLLPPYVPLSGELIIDRRVNIGQTVVAKPQRASLFLIGKKTSSDAVWCGP